MSGVRRMHLAVELPGGLGPAGESGGDEGRGGPRAGERAAPAPDFAAYARLAATAERGLFDFVLLDDGGSQHGGAHAYPLPGGRPEPVTVLNALAAVTGRIGLAVLAPPDREPYDLARGIAALDRLSGGRAAGPAGAVPEFAVPPSPQGRPVVIGDGDGDGVGADVVVGGPDRRVRPGAKLLARFEFTLTGKEPAAARDLADRLDARVQSGALDGYVLAPEPVPGGRGLDAFVDVVVPLLQKRGSLRTAYRGTTLREHLGLPRPRVEGLTI